MSEKHIELKDGDTLLVTVVSSFEFPSISIDSLEILLTIGSVDIYTNEDQSYVCFQSNLDVCNDGSGPAHNDPYHQAQTAYYNGGKFLNADVDKYMVVPPQIRSMVPGVVMGCRARVTNLERKVISDAVVGDIGPKDKTGETAYCLAKLLNPSITHNTGDSKEIYMYELWPDVAAVVDGKTYKLEPAG